MGRVYNKNNELILKRRKKRIIKKSLLLIVLLLSILITLCLKLSYFNVKNISVINNNNINADVIIKESNIYRGNNIFYLKLSECIDRIKRNPYILDVKIKRKLPNSIVINIIEREAVFYNKKGSKYAIIDNNGIVLEEKDSIDGMKLTRLDGVDYEKSTVGKTVVCDDNRKIEIVGIITKLIKENKGKIDMSIVDINNLFDIKIYSENMCIKLGSSDNLQTKLNKALNILGRDELKGAKGYVDVSFSGNPVFFIEK